jgi:hypothetical protein
MEHRCGRRFSTDVPVSMIALPSTIGAGRILNMSSTGAFIDTRLILPVLTLVYLEEPRALRRARPSERYAACVVRQCVSGVGVEWFDVAPDWVLVNAIERDRVPAGELAQYSPDLLLDSRRRHQSVESP